MLIDTALSAAHDALDAREQFGQVEGLGQVVVGTEVEALDFVFDAVACRDDDEAALLLYLLELAQQFQPIAIGEVDVEQDAVLRVVRDLDEPRAVVGRHLYDVALLLQCAAQYLLEREVVLDDQDFHISLSPSWGCVV